MKPSIRTHILAFACTALLSASSSAQVTISPLTSFGGGDGWLAPGEGGFAYLGTGSLERGMAYNPLNNHLYLVSRFNDGVASTHVRILDAATGLSLGGLNTTGILGGTFALNKVVVDPQTGSIYATNLRTGSSDPGFRIYHWANESSIPALIFDAIPDTGNPRVGDNLDLIGTGGNTQIVAGYGAVAGAPISNGYLVIDPTKSALSPTTPAYNNVDFATGTANGEFRLGLTFINAPNSDSATVLGTAGSSATAAKLTVYSGAVDDRSVLSGSLSGSVPLASNLERAFDYIEIGGIGLLATVEAFSSAALPGTSLVRLYDATNPAAPTLLTSLTTTTGTPNANSNSGGDIRFGLSGVDVDNNPIVTLFAMNTNNGIQAFVVTVPEPSAVGMLGLAALALTGKRRRGGCA